MKLLYLKYLHTVIIIINFGNPRSVSSIEPPSVSISFPKDLADVDFQNSTLAIMSNSYPAFDLNCLASYPVEWIMHFDEDDDGISEKEKTAESRRIVSDFKNTSSYIYSVTLRLQYSGKLYVFANYSCKSVDLNLQTHVITRTENRRNAILLQISSDRKYIQRSEKIESSKECKVFASVSDINDPSSCWRCEKSDGKELDVDFIGCDSAMQCNSNYQRQNQGRHCLKVISQRENTTCKRIGQKDYNPKIIVCKDLGPALAQFYYFGLSRMGKTPKMYFDWSEMDPQEMIYIRQIPNELYYGQNLSITCEMSKYYFAYGSWFGIEMDYGNQWDSIARISYEKGDDVDQEIWKASFASILNLTITEPAPDKIYCFAPVWNSSMWINSSVELQVQIGDKPKIVSLLPDKADKFEIGQKNRSIICTFSGEPSPEIKWTGPMRSYYTAETDISNSISILTIPDLTSACVGNWSCSVESFLGSDTKLFSLQADTTFASTALKLGLAIGGVALVILLAVVGFVVVRLLRIVKAQALRLLTETEINEFIEGNPDFVSKNEYFDSSIVIDALPYDTKYELPLDKLHIDYKLLLGSGAFAKVYKGTIDTGHCSHFVNVKKTDSKVKNGNMEVAVKTCAPDVDVMYFKAILSEIKVMAYIGHHNNVTALVGCCTKNIRKREIFIAMEFCPKGSLESYLRRNRNYFINMVQYGILKTEQELLLSQNNSYSNTDWTEENVITTKDLLKWTFDIASGIEFVHEKKVIHADLDVRNVLLRKDLVAKIGDFGLSRQLVECSNYVKKTQCPLPWRILAPESLKDLEFSVKSDVWAFGVTIWEVFTLAEIPYPGISWSLDFLSQLENGLRLTKPIYATNDIYEYMLKCWKIDRDERPDFTEIKSLCSESLKRLIPNNASQDYLTLCQKEGPYENPEGYLVPNAP